MSWGFVKIQRQLLDWEWFDDGNMLKLWIAILLNANHKDVEWHGEIIEKGSFVTSQERLRKQTGLTPRQIRTCLERLKKTREIDIKTTNKKTLITVIKWGDYQCQEVESDTKTTIKRQTNDKQTTTNKNNKKEKKESKYINILTKERKTDEEIIAERWHPFDDAMREFKEMRKSIKKPLTPGAEELLRKKLHRLSGGDEAVEIEILNQSTINSWQGVFPLKVEQQSPKPPREDIIPKYGTHVNPTVTDEDIEEFQKWRNGEVEKDYERNRKLEVD